MIIAECCTNWRDLGEAKRLIEAAKECGAGLVKFQLYDAEADRGKPHYAWVKAHELNLKQAETLFKYGEKIGIEIFFSVFAPQSVDWCEVIGVKRYKIASTFQRGPVELDAVIATRKPFILSIPNETLSNISHKQLPGLEGSGWLFCPPGYPPEGFRLPAFNNDSCPYDGFSDHTIGLDAAKIALARGAHLIEKHFVIEHNPDFPDDAWSMTPWELRELVRWEKVCWELLG